MKKFGFAVLLFACLAGMSASKTFNINDSKSVQIRIDSTNVLNHPTSIAPSFSANTVGVSNNKDGERSLQGQLRFMF